MNIQTTLKEVKVDLVQHENNFYYLILLRMKYLMEGKFEDNCMSGKVQIKEADISDVKDFIMNGMPEMIQDLFARLCQNLKEKAMEENLNPDKVISAMSLVAIICQNRVSENLTQTLNQFLWEFDPEQEDSDPNLWNSLSQ